MCVCVYVCVCVCVCVCGKGKGLWFYVQFSFWDSADGQGPGSIPEPIVWVKRSNHSATAPCHDNISHLLVSFIIIFFWDDHILSGVMYALYGWPNSDRRTSKPLYNIFSLFLVTFFDIFLFLYFLNTRHLYIRHTCVLPYSGALHQQRGVKPLAEDQTTRQLFGHRPP